MTRNACDSLHLCQWSRTVVDRSGQPQTGVLRQGYGTKYVTKIGHIRQRVCNYLSASILYQLRIVRDDFRCSSILGNLAVTQIRLPRECGSI